jgi:hypothetical protein
VAFGTNVDTGPLLGAPGQGQISVVRRPRLGLRERAKEGKKMLFLKDCSFMLLLCTARVAVLLLVPKVVAPRVLETP